MLSDVARSMGDELGVPFDMRWGRWAGCRVRWERTPRGWSMTVSDHLSDAPDDVLRAVAEACAGWTASSQRFQWPGPALAWLSDPSFAVRRRPLWASRCMLSDDRRLEMSVWRLEDRGLELPVRAYATRGARPSASRLFRACAVPQRALALPQDDLDALVWTWMCRADAAWPAADSEAVERETARLPGRRLSLPALSKEGLL